MLLSSLAQLLVAYCKPVVCTVSWKIHKSFKLFVFSEVPCSQQSFQDRLAKKANAASSFPKLSLCICGANTQPLLSLERAHFTILPKDFWSSRLKKELILNAPSFKMWLLSNYGFKPSLTLTGLWMFACKLRFGYLNFCEWSRLLCANLLEKCLTYTQH